MPTITETEILTQVVEPETPDLLAEAAKAILGFGFKQTAIDRINDLAASNRSGTISEAEREEFERYLRVGNFLNLVHAKARASLHQSRAG